MGNLSDIKRRLESVRQTRRITSAMKTVSVAKMRKASEAYEKSREYMRLLTRVVDAVAASEITDERERLFFDPPHIGRRLLLVISTDRGLCGGFDNEISKLANVTINDDTVVMPIGRTAGERFKASKGADLRFVESYSAEYSVAKKISDAILDIYGVTVDEVSVAYCDMLSHATYKPTVKTILPVKREPSEAQSAIYDFEPSEYEILQALLPLYLYASVYDAVLCNTVAEHCARRAAMSAATDSADRLANTLSIEYNRARQASVTEQIIEIIGSTSALDRQGGDNEKRS